jgi:anti-sigma regulatory factor (Ser/Thr protein kinase)
MNVESAESVSIPISDSSGVGEVRRAASSLAAGLGFAESTRENVAIVATEAASNVIKHAARGEVVVRRIHREGVMGVELLALDKGPGMSDVSRCLRDGYSTAGSPGTGLGAIARLSTMSEIHSIPGKGTALLARLCARPNGETAPVEVSAVNVAKANEEVSGDAWGAVVDGRRAVVMVADGLGHGPLAARASQTAIDVFRQYAGSAPVEILEAAHGALRSTRGAAVAVADVDLDGRTIRYAGVGNISGVIVTPTETRQMVSHNGTVGLDVRRIQEFVYPFPAGARLVMHSDGLVTHWRTDTFVGLWHKHPSLVAGILYREFTRGRDDVTVAVLAETRTEGVG